MVETCPTCGREFDTYSGLSTHHARKHPAAWVDRFEYLVDGGNPEECWPWQGVIMGAGYGQFKHDGERYYAHRLAYRIEYGPIPKPQINHHCDNPPCVNPNHLYSGTHSDNMRDACERNEGFLEHISSLEGADPREIDGMGYSPSGVESPNSKFVRADIVEIRERAGGGETHREIAEDFDVNHSTISRIVRGDVYPDV